MREEPPKVSKDIAASAGARHGRPAATRTVASAGPADWPLHPFLFAAYAVVAPYAANLRETSFRDVVPTAFVVFAVTLAIFAGMAMATRRAGPRAALLTSTLLLTGLFFASLFERLNPWLGGALPQSAQLPLALAGAAALLALAALARFRLTLPNALLNGVALVLLAAPLWHAASYEWATVRTASPVETKAFAQDAAAAPAVAATGRQPDIYYLIFDRYASEAILRNEFGFDNGPFVGFLRSQGFYVASQSVSNYLKTAPSIASSLHMDYIGFLSGEARSSRSDWHPIYDMLDDHRVARFLKARGYRYVQVGGWWGPTQHNDFADENRSFGFDEYEWLFLRRTILPPLLQAAAPASDLARDIGWDNAQCRRAPLQMEAIRTASAGGPQPTFTFAHVLLPHEPFVFDAAGRCLPIKATWDRGFRTGYLGQLRYANTLIEDLVRDILAKGGVKPIIIIQADEGPFPQRYRFGDKSWREATPRELKMKTGILNAYFFPDGDYSALYPQITPVNSFRTVFNQFFGTDYARLPDRVFAMPTTAQLYDFFDVTDIVRDPRD